MDILREIIVIVHLIGFATLFGGWVVELFGKRRISKVMQWGLVIALIAGVILAAPFGMDGDPNYAKLGTKLVIVIVIGALLGIGGARQRRTDRVPPALFWPVGILALANACIAILW